MALALSYSRISDFRNCPRKFRLKYIDKDPRFFEDDKKSPHLIRGGNVHKELEKYVIKRRAGEQGIPVSSLSEVESTKPIINGLMQIYDLHPELQVAINENFERVDWFSKEAWFRVIYDAIGFGKDLLLADYKTGKLTDYSGSLKEPGQLHFAGLIGMAVWPQFTECSAVYLYVDHKKPIMAKFSRDLHFNILKTALQEEHAMINDEKDFAEKPNSYCKYCLATNVQCSKGKIQC